MKLARLLKSIGLYDPAERMRKISIDATSKIKSSVYNRSLKKHRQLRKLGTKKRRVLVVMNDGIGNTVEATPLVQAIRMFWPCSEITILTSSGDLFDGWCVPDRIAHSVEDIDNKNFDHIFLTYSTHWDSRRKLEQFNPGQVHKPKQYFDEVFLKPEREYNLDMIRRLGFRGQSPPLYVSIKQPSPPLLPEGFVLCFLPCSKPEPRWQNKRWPYYTELAKLLIENHSDLQICILGTQNDPVDDKLLSLERVTDLRDKLTLAEVARVLKKVDLVVGNDCGPMHIADAVGATGISIFGPSCELKNSPCNKISTVSLNLPCSPCQYNGPITCDNSKCMLQLTAISIKEKLEQLLVNKQ